MQITLSAPATYNPDIIEDLKNRLLDAYREALAARQAVEGVEITTEDAE